MSTVKVFLIDPNIINLFVQHVAGASGSIVEIGPGSGALTFPMSRLRRPIIAVEIDATMVKTLNNTKPGGSIEILHANFLSYHLTTYPHVVAGNLPFSLTTAILRKLFRAPGWTNAVLLMQWEVARRRAGAGGATMMTAQWAPCGIARGGPFVWGWQLIEVWRLKASPPQAPQAAQARVLNAPSPTSSDRLHA